ncbi:hypothetical protein BHAOGJBA_4146 [Methylobacterium hispanicum]|uniref:Resolvase HTH domain-containing protein n=1 Tax=Methylobacterium hispanicum TaxID=270350 RepID=A0AAV4ZQ03_9HYPH|nr:hypothetical protein [Methylobacterium hispanicum]GJD90604.1 hypothetical protein BHAOGJBA_4146 [Methylobacterium hispanicum]
MSDGVYSIDIAVRAMPAASLVARIVDSYGADAAAERWAWLGERTISTLAQKGRAQAGDVAPRRAGGRPMACSEIDAAVAIESGFALGSASRGIRAAGITVSYQGVYSRRGLTPPMISPAERGIASALAGAARRGDAKATAAWESRLAFEAAVGSVVRAALALVPEQPATGRYVFPPAAAALAEALRDQDPGAVAAVFPALAEIAQAEPEPTAIEPPPILETRAMPRHRLLPPDAVLLAERAKGRKIAQIAADWGVSVQAVYAHLRRLDIAVLSAPTKAPPPKPQIRRLLAVPPPGRLSAGDLALAVELARRKGITPAAAVEFVRADVAQVRPVAPDLPPAGFPAPRMSPALTDWFQALADGRDLPELEMEDFNV